MPPLVPALGGALAVAGILALVAGIRRVPELPDTGPRRSVLLGRWRGVRRSTRLLLLAGLVAGIVAYLLTGWLIAVPVGPLAVAGLPLLLSAPAGAERVAKLEALEEWTRGLAGVLTVGVGLEEALRATLRSTPPAIRPEVTRLVARIRARVGTEDSLRAFADDLDDEVGDTVASYLILGARRRGQGLASVLNTLAESVAHEVRDARAIEADRAKPRTTARVVTLLTVGALGLLAFSGEYMDPYRTAAGQVLLVFYLTGYVVLLIWMRQMTAGKKAPRFLGTAVAGGEA
ncbi:type II secretion system protein [Isoptericola halotolerans]|uniref:Flp pilus assembly protein TadB n=1 Tax=Isoptericola halotolerans TaxID=300560 RepID=A0ABX2A3C5_9MICO|nr:type II secretion system F family protein [Isoptericola halotolerans]NOV97357.1 Flp pilus assembly protein TadB [Isoptericola halotolerans]